MSSIEKEGVCMSCKSIPNNQVMAKKITPRRNELNLTIEEAATKANVGIKTWCRYETGGAIRQDKYKGVCRALNWMDLADDGVGENIFTGVLRTKNHEAWSVYIENMFGEEAAAAFAIGSDILLDYVEDELNKLASLPKGSHIGQNPLSYLAHMLPEQFLMEYDYEFLYGFKQQLIKMRACAGNGSKLIAHSVLEEILIYLIVNEARYVLEIDEISIKSDFKDWAFDFFEDMDVVTYLYSDMYVEEEDVYHFKYWMKRQFHC